MVGVELFCKSKKGKNIQKPKDGSCSKEQNGQVSSLLAVTFLTV